MIKKNGSVNWKTIYKSLPLNRKKNEKKDMRHLGQHQTH